MALWAIQTGRHSVQVIADCASPRGAVLDGAGVDQGPAGSVELVHLVDQVAPLARPAGEPQDHQADEKPRKQGRPGFG